MAIFILTLFQMQDFIISRGQMTRLKPFTIEWKSLIVQNLLK